MKGYKFKLDAVLKMRKLKEDMCKQEIGRIQVQIRELESQRKKHNAGIDESYLSQEKGLEGGLSGQELRFHPFFVSGKKAHIDLIDSKIQMLTNEVNSRYDELKRLRGNVKVIEEMKEKDKTQYKKKIQKKQFEEIEEQNQNWRQITK